MPIGFLFSGPIRDYRCPVCGSEISVTEHPLYWTGLSRFLVMCSNPDCVPFMAECEGRETATKAVIHEDISIGFLARMTEGELELFKSILRCQYVQAIWAYLERKNRKTAGGITETEPPAPQGE